MCIYVFMDKKNIYYPNEKKKVEELKVKLYLHEEGLIISES